MVPAEPPVLHEPRERPLDHPPPGVDAEPVRGDRCVPGAWAVTAEAPELPSRHAGLAVCSIFLVGLAVLPFLPETKDKPLPE